MLYNGFVHSAKLVSIYVFKWHIFMQIFIFAYFTKILENKLFTQLSKSNEKLRLQMRFKLFSSDFNNLIFANIIDSR